MPVFAQIKLTIFETRWQLQVCGVLRPGLSDLLCEAAKRIDRESLKGLSLLRSIMCHGKTC